MFDVYSPLDVEAIAQKCWKKYLWFFSGSECEWFQESEAHMDVRSEAARAVSKDVRNLHGRLYSADNRWSGLVTFTEPFDGMNWILLVELLDTGSCVVVTERDTVSPYRANAVYVLLPPSRAARFSETTLLDALGGLSPKHAIAVVQALSGCLQNHRSDVRVVGAIVRCPGSDELLDLATHTYHVLRDTALLFAAERDRACGVENSVHHHTLA